MKSLVVDACVNNGEQLTSSVVSQRTQTFDSNSNYPVTPTEPIHLRHSQIDGDDPIAIHILSCIQNVDNGNQRKSLSVFG